MPNSSKKNTRRTFLFLSALLPLFFVAIPVFAADLTSQASVSPTTIYSNTAYTVSATISNPNFGPVGVLYYWYKDGVQSQTCYGGSAISANSSTSTSCPGSTGSGGTYRVDVYHSDTSRGWNLLTSASVTVTITARPVATASLKGSSPVSYNSGTYLTWSSSNASSCTLTNFGSVPTSNSGTGYYTGNLKTDTIFTLSCSPNSGATGSPTSSVTIRVNPPPVVNYTLSISVSSGSGSILCNGSSCVSSYQSGTALTLTASPSSGYSFSGWGGTCSGTGSCSLTMNSNKSASASFTEIPTYLLVTTVGNGSGSISGAGSYAPGTTVTARATPSSGYVFSDWWPGCDSTSGNSCTITMNSARTVTANFAQLSATAGFTNPTDGFTLNYNGGTYFTWTSSNTTGCSISSSPALSGYPKTGLPTYNNGTAYWSGNMKDNAVFTLNCTPISGSSGTPTSNVSVNVNPLPTGNCTASFQNNISMTTVEGVRAWRTTVNGGISNCPSTYFTNLEVSGTLSLDDSDGPNPLRIFDFAWPFEGSGGSYNLNTEACSYILDLQTTGGKAILGRPTRKLCSEGVSGATATGDLHFALSNVVGLFNSWYENSLTGDNVEGGYDDYFYPGYLPWGNYNVHISNAFSGTYKCPDGDVLFRVPVPLTVCAYEPNDGNEKRYYDSKCTPINPNRASVPLNCPSAPVTIVVDPVRSTPTPGIPVDFAHTLNVQSTLDGTSKPGVNIAQISVSDPDPNFSFPPNYFAGTTNYTRLAERNVTVVLEAPQDHSQGGALKARPDSWTGCDSISSNGRECTVSFEFTALGGQKKTIIANYSSSLTAPVVLTSSASCDANGGKINVYLQSAVSGATGYHIYRSTSPFTAVRKNWFNIAYAQTVVELDSDKNPANGIQPFITPPTQSNPFVDDRGLVPNTTYYYRAVAFNSSVSSPASAEISRAASLPCPDLIVEPNSVEIINSATSAIISPTAVPSNISIKFRAKIRNQNGAIVPPPTSFDNQFTLDNQTTLFFPSKLLQAALAAGALSDFLTTGSWTPTIGSHSLQVCADVPVNTGGVIEEKNLTGNAEQNNCLSTPFSFSVVVPISVQLQCENQGGVFKNDYCVIDYSQASSLKWTTNGTSCKWVTPPSDAIGTASGNSLSLTNLLNKLSFNYQLECTK